MKPPLRPAFKRTLICGFAALALAVGGILAWQRGRPAIRTDEVEAFLDRTVGGGRVRFSDVALGAPKPEGAELTATVAATARTLQPLYTQIDAADYLKRAFGLDAEATAEARRLLAGKGASQNPRFGDAGPFPADPYQATVLELASPAGTPFRFQGVIGAHRDGGAWGFLLVSGGFEGGGPLGEPRSAFGESSFAAGDPGDEARLRALVNGLQAFAGRVAESRRNFDAARGAAIEGRRKAFLAQIVPGRFFRGSALETGDRQETPLYLEITGVAPGDEVTALLRNDGGWHFARAFQGEWSADDAFENPVLNLTSSPDQAVRDGGPFLEDTQTRTFALSVDSQGGLSEKNQYYRYRFLPVGAEQATALRARLEAEFAQAMAAAAPGSLYQGVAISRNSDASEPILLRFTGRSEDGDSVEARIESTTRSWTRPFRGTIVANARRSGGAPIRLRTRAKEAVEDAPAESVLGQKEDSGLRLGGEGGSLVGEDERFTYRFAAVAAADLRGIEADRAERARRFMAILRDGIVYDGVLRDDQGYVTDSRLEIGRIDRRTGGIAARMRSRLRLDVYQDFLGTCDPAGGSIALGATGRGVFDNVDPYGAPFFMAAAPMTLHLALIGNSISGRIAGDPHWTMDFPAGALLSAPTESPESNPSSAAGSVFPPFPKEGGAYLLSRGSWKPLPRNHGHVAIEKIRAGAPEEASSGVLDSVVSGIGRLSGPKQKVPYLEFDGKAPRPEADGAAIVLLFVGPEPPGTPPVELARAEVLKDGRRRIEVAAGPPAAIQFGEQRAAAYVRSAAPDCILLTATSPLERGPYAFNAAGGYELTVK